MSKLPAAWDERGIRLLLADFEAAAIEYGRATADERCSILCYAQGVLLDRQRADILDAWVAATGQEIQA